MPFLHLHTVVVVLLQVSMSIRGSFSVRGRYIRHLVGLHLEALYLEGLYLVYFNSFGLKFSYGLDNKGRVALVVA